MKKIVAIALTAVALAGCEYVPFTDASRIAEAKRKIAFLSANPTTVRFENVKVGPAGDVCGVFNAQEEGYPIRSELTWTGPRHFLTFDGEPAVVSNYDDCEKAVGAYSRCFNDGDAEKIEADVTACRTFQTEEAERAREHTEGLMRSSGLIRTGNRERDQATWDAAMVPFSNGGGMGEDGNVRLRSTERFKSVYNARMRQVPDNATTDQKVAAAAAAATAASAELEAVLREGGIG